MNHAIVDHVTKCVADEPDTADPAALVDKTLKDVLTVYQPREPTPTRQAALVEFVRRVTTVCVQRRRGGGTWQVEDLDEICESYSEELVVMKPRETATAPLSSTSLPRRSMAEKMAATIPESGERVDFFKHIFTEQEQTRRSHQQALEVERPRVNGQFTP